MDGLNYVMRFVWKPLATGNPRGEALRMNLDLHRNLTDEHGEIDEEAAAELEAELMERFAQSPEARPLVGQGEGGGRAC